MSCCWLSKEGLEEGEDGEAVAPFRDLTVGFNKIRIGEWNSNATRQ
jgi:hypothetical protein